MIKIAAILLLFCNAALGAEYVACRGISDSLKQIQVMAGVSTGAAGVGTLTGAAAVITGIAKNAKDTQLAKLDTMKEDEIVALWKKMKLAEGQIDGIEKKKLIVAGKLKEQSQTLGNVRTVTLGATTATSAVAAVSAGFGVKNVDDLIGKMNSCNEELKSLENIQLKMRMEGTAETDPEYSKISNILANCKKFNVANIESIKKLMTVSTVASAVGGVAALTGTITSAMAVTKEKNAGTQNPSSAGNAESKKAVDTKGLNLAANISAGVATVASGTSLALGAASLSKLNADAENAKNCEAAL